MKKDYIMTGYFWDENNCQNEVYIQWYRNLSRYQRDDLALREYKQFRKQHPELNVSDSVIAFENYQYKKVHERD